MAIFSLLGALLLGSQAFAALVPPTQDPWYTPTGSWQSEKPGAILKHRPVPNKLVNVAYQSAYQILYRTTDSLGNATAAVTTVIIPVKPDYTKLLSYQIVYDTPDVDCSPSFALQEGGQYIIDDGFTLGLNSGWVVNTPDYEGPLASFTAGVISGQATLDSIRAALASSSFTKINSDPTIAMWGYSGGALASEWACELQPSYAPELKIAGAAMGGLTPNVTSVAESTNDSPNSGLIAAGIIGLESAYPNITHVVNSSFVSTAKMNEFYGVKKECISQIGKTYYDQNMLGYFNNGQQILMQPDIVAVINAGGIMGVHGTPAQTNKLYVYKSVYDEVSPVADTDALVEKYCQAGVDIQYVKDKFGDHAEEAVNGGLGAFEFLMAIFGDSYNTTGCTVTTKNKAGTVLSSSTIAATPSSTASSTAGGSSPSSSGSSSATPSAAASSSTSSSAGNAHSEAGTLVGLVISAAMLLDSFFF